MNNDKHRLEEVLSTGTRLLEVISEQQITPEQIQQSDTIQWMVTTPLYHIGEQINHLSPAITEQHPEIPWRQIAGLRYRLVHDYAATDWFMITAIIFSDLPSLLKSVEEIVKLL